jgi:hypothetical protein
MENKNRKEKKLKENDSLEINYIQEPEWRAESKAQLVKCMPRKYKA